MLKYLRQVAILFLAPIWRLLAWSIPKRADFIAVNTIPDFDDTVRSIGNEVTKENRTLVVLTCQVAAAIPSWAHEFKMIVAHRYSLRGIWLFHRCRYVLFTHGLFSFWSSTKRQTILNLWHGMPIKRIGLLSGQSRSELERFDYTIAYDERYRSIIAEAFGVPESKVLLSAHPRIDGMSIDQASALDLPPCRYLTMWLPTYRRSVRGEIRTDGNSDCDFAAGHVSLKLIDQVLKENDCVCLFKPHPMSELSPAAFSACSNIIYIDDEQIHRQNLTLYQLLGRSDFLITDVSSIYFDYKFTTNPIVVFCPDIEDYGASRGFVAPITELIEEEIVVDATILAERLEQLFAQRIKASPSDERTFKGGSARSLLKVIGAI